VAGGGRLEDGTERSRTVTAISCNIEWKKPPILGAKWVLESRSLGLQDRQKCAHILLTSILFQL
jgi:hypothetical protein